MKLMGPEKTQQAPDRNSYTIEELMLRNSWSRNYTYSLIGRGILRTYKDGRRRLPPEANRRRFVGQR